MVGLTAGAAAGVKAVGLEAVAGVGVVVDVAAGAVEGAPPAGLGVVAGLEAIRAGAGAEAGVVAEGPVTATESFWLAAQCPGTVQIK